MSYSCQSSKYTLFQGTVQTCNNTCGQFADCLTVFYKDGSVSSVERGCCREGYLYPNAATIIVYILIMPIIGIGSLGALGGGVVKRPFLESVLNFNSNNSGNITACLMFGAQLVNQIIISFQSHPYHPQQPAVNYEVGMIYALAIPISMQFGQELAAYMPLLPVLTLQMMFFIVICPILLLFAKRQEAVEQDEDEVITDSSFSMTAAFKGSTIQEESKSAQLFKHFIAESHQRFPILPILIAFGSFAVNEAVILTRTTNYQNTPYSYNSERENPCNVWNFYMMLLLFTVNIIITLGTLYYFRKREMIKDRVKFRMRERYFTPIKRFFMIYGAGWATGFIAGFLGMAAGLTMFVTMVEFGLVAASAGATANYGYFFVCLQVFINLSIGEAQNQTMTIGDQFFYYGLGIVGVLIFTNIGYYYINKYKVGHVLFYIDFALVLLNMIGNIAWGVQQSDRYTYHSIVYNDQSCTTTQSY